MLHDTYLSAHICQTQAPPPELLRLTTNMHVCLCYRLSSALLQRLLMTSLQSLHFHGWLCFCLSWQLAPDLTVKLHQTKLLTMSVDAVGLQCQEEEQQQATGSLCNGSESCG